MTKMFKLVPDWMVEFAADNKENASAAKGLAEFQVQLAYICSQLLCPHLLCVVSC